MEKYALVTGAAGFVGSYLSKKLLADGWHVTIVDDLSNGKEQNIPENAEFYKIDLSVDNALDELPEYPYQVVFHCAAQASNAISWLEPKRDMMANQLGTLNVLQFCVSRNIMRVIFTSSMSAYGEPEMLPTPESVTLLPDTFYAVHKLASEHYLRIFAKEYGINTTTFRLYTTYGHGQNMDNINQGLLSIYLSFIVNKKTIIVKGSKDRTRDLVHVSDVVEALMLAWDNPKSYGKTYNLGAGESLTIEEIIDQLIVEIGYKKGEYPVIYKEGTQGDPFNTLADIQSAQEDLGWFPKISAKTGIKLTVHAIRQAQ